MGRTLRTAVNPFFEIGAEVRYKNSRMKFPAPASYLVHSGRNTAWIQRDGRSQLVSVEQLEHPANSFPLELAQPMQENASDPPASSIVSSLVRDKGLSAATSPQSAQVSAAPLSPVLLRRSQRLAAGVRPPVRLGFQEKEAE